MNNNKIETKGQQGDVIMRKVGDTKPAGGEVISKGMCILARGEGHHLHVIEAEDTDAQLIREGERMLLWLEKPSKLHHVPAPQGNEPIRLCQADHEVEEYPRGLWEVGGVREVDHFQQLERRVMD
jgi:hypothetical protein